MNLPPFPEGFLPRSPEERLMLVQWGEQCRAMYKEDAERLDWLEAWHTTRDREFANGDSGINLIDRVSDGWMVDGEVMPNAYQADRTFDTLRQAIDAARSATLREKPDLSTEVLRETPDLSTSALIEAQAITGRQLMARLSAGEAFINAPTRVCDETDVVCSRGCGAGPCKAKK